MKRRVFGGAHLKGGLFYNSRPPRYMYEVVFPTFCFAEYKMSVGKRNAF